MGSEMCIRDRLTSVAIVVMCLHPEARVLAKLARPASSLNVSLPCFAWAPRVSSKNGSVSSQSTHAVVSWGHVVQLVELDLAANMYGPGGVASRDRIPHHDRNAIVHIRKEMVVEAPVLALAWLTDEVIVAVLTPNHVVAVSSQTGEIFEEAHSCEVPVHFVICLLYTSPSPRDATLSRMPSSA